jgi:cardiolipin synthase (CMP-forming)
MIKNQLQWRGTDRRQSTTSRADPPQRLWREMTGSLPNQLTTLRLALIPPLWLLALTGYARALGVVLAIAAFTDVLDGYLARRSRQVTEFGSRFDSIADHLLSASVFAWLLLLRPEFVREQRTLLLIWLALAATALLVGWLRFGRVGALHLYSAKASGFLGYCFAIYLLIFGTYPTLLFHLVIGVCLIGAAETLLVQLTRNEVDEHLGSIVRRPPTAMRGRVAAKNRRPEEREDRAFSTRRATNGGLDACDACDGQARHPEAEEAGV